jgi:hypothetical protein
VRPPLQVNVVNLPNRLMETPHPYLAISTLAGERLKVEPPPPNTDLPCLAVPTQAGNHPTAP